ncbi:anthranilate synthase / indole-3-glycerol phosphate synthase [Balamuthia mandrillaris]
MTSILQKICAQRLLDIQRAKQQVPLEELQRPARLNRFSLVDLRQRLLRASADGHAAVMAEVKRASPSKGDIAPDIDAAKQGRTYAEAGAAAISCLTEPTWFKGTLEDMQAIRESIEELGAERPALLRKDFILDEYQVYEARAYGADSVLLIVAAFENEDRLKELLRCSRALNMEPLVEAANEEECKVALRIGARLLGINNRNLHDFKVDLGTTARLLQSMSCDSSSSAESEEVLVAALSGISSRKDVAYFEQVGAKAVLVGEALMRASDPFLKIQQLRGQVAEEEQERKALVKICGVQDPEMAITTAEAGADFIGLVFATKSRRCISVERASEIQRALSQWRRQRKNGVDREELLTREQVITMKREGGKEDVDAKSEWFHVWARKIRQVVNKDRPLLVGVFADDDPERVNAIAKEVPLDLVQLSGGELLSSAANCCVPTIKAFHVKNNKEANGGETNNLLSSILEATAPLEEEEDAATKKNNTIISALLDTFDPSVRGGTGRAFDWTIAAEIQKQQPIFLAGGLTPENVAEAVAAVKPFAVDVSSGVEDEKDGKKDVEKIRAFVLAAKSVAV